MTDKTPRVEVTLKVDGQWFYRGNVSPAWFARNSLPDGSMGGIAERVERHVWPILEELQAARRDQERLDWLETRLHGADFAYGSPPVSVLMFQWPDTPVGADLRSTIDAAMQDGRG